MHRARRRRPLLALALVVIAGLAVLLPWPSQRVDACAFDPKYGTVFASCGDGTLTAARVSDAGKVSAAETDSTARGARTMAFDETTGRVFVVTAAFGPAPAPTADRPHPRPTILPGTFEVLVLER